MPKIPTGMKANAGYKKGTWDVQSFPSTVSGTDTVTYTHTFKPIAYVDYVYVVEHYKQLSSGAYVIADKESFSLRIELNADEDGFEFAQSAVTAIAKNYGAHYSENLTYIDRIASGTPEFGKQLTLKLFYALDSHTVKYSLNGGTALSGVDYGAKTVLCGNGVTVQAAPHRMGYTFEGWLSDNGELYSAGDKFILESDVTLTAQWEKMTGLSYTVHYFEEGTNMVIKTEKRVNGMTFEDIVNSSSEVIKIDGYLFSHADPTSLTIGIDESKNIINLYYTADRLGGGDGGEQPDEIPDKYQKKVIFKVVNGTWDGTVATDIVKYVTLMTDGKWDVNGAATIDETLVPSGMIANDGFENGTWDETFPVTVVDTTDVTYTFTFVSKPVVNPDTADNGHIFFWIASAFACVACVYFIVDRRRKTIPDNK